MQPPLRIAVSIVLLSSALASYHSNTKLRRDGVLNLYPFPRVGRASRNTWQIPLNDLYLEYEPTEEKRQLYAFPRVGRSGLRDAIAAPPRRTEHAGMWFGPRVGRSDRAQPAPARRSEQPGYEPVEKRQMYAFPRVGRGDGALDQSGMWFGPRIGRSDDSLRDSEPVSARRPDQTDITIQNDTFDRSEPEQIETVREERKKRHV